MILYVWLIIVFFPYTSLAARSAEDLQDGGLPGIVQAQDQDASLEAMFGKPSKVYIDLGKL